MYYSTVRQLLFIVILLIGSVASFAGYYVALIDWVQDYNKGIYATNYWEAVLETSALFLYSYLAIRFMKNKVNL